MGRIQSSYSVNPDIGFPGAIARPSEPHAMESGVVYVPTSGRKPRPGDALYYNQTNDGWATPASAANSLVVMGICSYRADAVQDASQVIEFDDGDFIQVVTMGTVWATFGTAAKYGDRMVWDRSDYKWDKGSDPAGSTTAPANLGAVDDYVNAALKQLERLPVFCASKSVDANGIGQLKIGYGRVF